MANAQFVSVILPNENIGAASGNIVLGVGHAAFILVNPNTGGATFYEYGTWANGSPGVVTDNPLTTNAGNVREFQITPGTIQFDGSGNATQASLQNALNQVFGSGGLYAGEDPGVVFANPFTLTSTQSSSIHTAVSSFIANVNAGGTDANYSLTGSSGAPNCINFVYAMANAGLLTISTTQNSSGVSIPTVAVDGIFAQAGTGYQYISPYSWDATSGQSSMTQVSGTLNLTSLQDFKVQLEQSIQNVGSEAGNLLDATADWISGQIETNGLGLPEWVLGSSTGNQLTATFNGTQSPVTATFSNSSGTPILQLAYNSDGSDTLTGYTSTGATKYTQTNSAASNGILDVAISGLGDSFDLNSAAISLASAAQAEVDGISNTITAAASAVLTLGTSASSNSVTANGAATVDDSGHSDSTTAANGSTINITNTSGNADSVAMNSGTVNLGGDVVGNIYGSGDTINVGAASVANTGGTGHTVNVTGSGSVVVDSGSSDLVNLNASNVTAYIQGNGSSATATAASDGLILQNTNQTSVLEGSGGS